MDDDGLHALIKGVANNPDVVLPCELGVIDHGIDGLMLDSIRLRDPNALGTKVEPIKEPFETEVEKLHLAIIRLMVVTALAADLTMIDAAMMKTILREGARARMRLQGVHYARGVALPPSLYGRIGDELFNSVRDKVVAAAKEVGDELKAEEAKKGEPPCSPITG